MRLSSKDRAWRALREPSRGYWALLLGVVGLWIGLASGARSLAAWSLGGGLACLWADLLLTCVLVKQFAPRQPPAGNPVRPFRTRYWHHTRWRQPASVPGSLLPAVLCLALMILLEAVMLTMARDVRWFFALDGGLGFPVRMMVHAVTGAVVVLLFVYWQLALLPATHQPRGQRGAIVLAIFVLAAFHFGIY